MLGNHTDYNGGHVLATAVDRHVIVAGDRSSGGRTRVHSCLFDETIELPAGSSPAGAPCGWRDYVAGAMVEIGPLARGLPAFDAVIQADLPAGAGLSSSAALSLALCRFLLHLGQHHLPALDLVRIAQRIENDHAGVPCGLLDPYCAAHGQADHVMLINCAQMTHDDLPWPNNAPAIVIVDSGVSRTLRASGYADRRAECERAAGLLAAALDRPISALCDVSASELEQAAHDWPEPMARRARHVIGEHQRAQAGAQAVRNEDWVALGSMMSASQTSSQTNFENSGMELNVICDLANRHRACLGSRLTGAGWAGGTVHLVHRRQAESFCKSVLDDYEQRGFANGRAWVCSPAGGAATMRLRGSS